MAHQTLRRSKAETIVSDHFHEVPEVRLLGDVENHEVMAIALLIPEKQVFDPDARHIFPVHSGFFASKDGGMFVRRIRDAHGIQCRIDFCRDFTHAEIF